jgi:hypothetical protein
MRQITVYESGDLLTADQAADVLGYSRDYFRAMLRLDDKAADLKLIRLKIETDEAWRKINKSRARFVFEYDALKAWYATRNKRKEVKDKTWARRGTPSPAL